MKQLSLNLAAFGFLVTSSVAYADYTAELEIDRMPDTPFKECNDYTFRQVMNNFLPNSLGIILQVIGAQTT
ncbi:hypothetical protein [Pseudoalteromonas sp. GCY]|nr:hypothetical protein [Pseudoalteromonas sp. GCY]